MIHECFFLSLFQFWNKYRGTLAGCVCVCMAITYITFACFFSEVSVVILSFVVWKPKFKKSTKKKKNIHWEIIFKSCLIVCCWLLLFVCLFAHLFDCRSYHINFICFLMFFLLLVYFIWIYIKCLFYKEIVVDFFLLSLVIWSSRFESEWLSVANSQNTPRFFIWIIILL